MMPLLIILCCTPLDLPYLSPEIFLQILYSHLNEVPQKAFQPSQPFALLWCAQDSLFCSFHILSFNLCLEGSKTASPKDSDT